MAYMEAAIRFVDDMVGKLMDTLANYPDLYNNTIIVSPSGSVDIPGERECMENLQMWKLIPVLLFIQQI